jgi:hypothetical protein
MNREEIESGIVNMESYKTAIAKLRTAGLVVPQKPPDAVTNCDLSAEWESMKRRYGGVANIPFEELGEFLDRWTAMISYARWTEAIADIDCQTSREVRDTIKKQLYTVQSGGREIREAMVSTEAIYIQWEQKYIQDNALYIMIKGLREGYEGRANAISREITRRMSEVSGSNRAHNRGYGA